MFWHTERERERREEKRGEELVMALQCLLSQLRHKGLRSSSACRIVQFCGVGTSLWKSTPLPPLMSSTQHFHTFTHYPLDTSGSGGSSMCYDEEETPENRRPFRFNDLVLRYRPQRPNYLQGQALARARTAQAADTVRGSMVCVAFLQDSKASVVFSGTIVRSDGIVATSSNCLRHLKGTKYEIGVKILGSRTAYKGVLLHTDFVSNIAFVKILRCEHLPVPECRKLDALREGGRQMVAAGCTGVDGGYWMHAICRYSVGSFSSIEGDTEVTESHNARTSGKLIKVAVDFEEFVIGGALVSCSGGLLGVIHNAHGAYIHATPIEDVLKYLEYFTKDV